MSVPADTYLTYLEGYLHEKNLKIKKSVNETFKLEENENGNKYHVNIKHKGKAFLVKLDAKREPLFNFLNESGHEWASKCDFIIFQSYRASVRAYCIEMKNTPSNLPIPKIKKQLDAGLSWCQTLNSIIKSYKGKNKKITVKKFAFTTYSGTASDLFDQTGLYFNSDRSIRHCKISDIEGLYIDDIENQCCESA